MELNIVVVGSGLSSAFFCEGYLNSKSEIDIISNNFTDKRLLNNTNININKDYPLQVTKGDLLNINDFEIKNNIEIDKNANIFNSLNKWGNSNFWGYGLDIIYDKDIEEFSYNEKMKIKNIFKKIYKQYNFIGNPDDQQKFSDTSNFIQNKFISTNKDNNFKITKTFLAINKNFINKSFNFKNWNKIRDSNDTLNPKTFFDNLSKRKKINFHNLFIKNINYEKENFILECIDKNNKLKIVKTKKIILCCGTISTTRLITNLINYQKEIKILHHPMNFNVFISKNKFKENNFIPALINLQSAAKNINFNSNIRLTSEDIEKKIIEKYKLLFTFNFQKKIFKYLSNYLLFTNSYLDTEFSNLFFLNDSNKIRIYSKERNDVITNLKIISKSIRDRLLSQNLIFPIYKDYFPGFGADYHYMGTIPISNYPSQLSVNENCEFSNYKNLFIADGSVINFKTNTSPMGVIFSNAYRIGEIVSKI